MYKYTKVFFLFLCFITGFAFAAPVVESVAISGDKLIVTGHQFLDIDGLILSDPKTGFKKPFKVESATESEIVGTAVDNQKITVASLMNLIIDTAKGETTYPVSFSLQKDAVTNPTIKNGAITPEKFIGVTTPNPPDQSVLTWDEPTQSFIFTSSSGGSGSSGVSDIVLGAGITGAPNTASGSVPISVDIGATGSTSKTKIPYFNSKNKIVLDSTSSPVGSLTGLSFKDGTQNFYIFNDNGLRINSNVAPDLFVLSVDGNLSLKGPVTVGGYDVCLSSGNCTSAPSGTSTVTATAPLIAATTSTGTTNISAGAVNTANNLVQLDSTGKFPSSIPGVVRGPGSAARSATSGNLAIFSDTTGEKLGDGGIGLQNLVSMSATPTSANKIVISTGTNKVLGTTAYTIPNTSGVTGQVLAITATNTASWINGGGVTSFKTRTGAVVPVAGDYTADQVTNLPLGVITATTVQQAIDQLATLDSQKLPKAGGTMTGTITTSTQNALKIGPFASGTGEVQFLEPTAAGTNYVGFKSPASIASNTVWTLPATDGTSGQVLSTNGSKVLSWTTAGAGGGIGDVVGPATSTLNNLATFSGATGKNIKDSGINSGNLPTMATAATALNKIIISAGASKQLTTTLYPIPPAIGASGTVLKSDGTNVTWQPDSGGAGNVVGPASSIANSMAYFSDSTGKNITSSPILTNSVGDLWDIRGMTLLGPITNSGTLANSGNLQVGPPGGVLMVVQVAEKKVGIGTNAPSQILQIDSTTSGFLPPRMTTAQKDAIPTQTTGMVVFDTSLNSLSVRKSTGWAGTGDVVGPAVATVANRPALYANTTGKLLTEAPYTLPITAGTTGQVLGLTGAGITGWVNPGNVVGAASSTTNAISKYSDTTGKNLTSSGVLINAANDISGIAKLTSTGDMVVDTNTFKVDAANNRVGIGTTAPSQVFQIDSTISGFLPPRMTTAQKNAIPTQTTGLVVFDTNLNSLSVRKSTGWAGTGDVVGPAVATVANRPALYADASGKLLKEAPYTLPLTAGTTSQVLGLTGTGTVNWVNTGNVVGPETGASTDMISAFDGNGKKLKGTPLYLLGDNKLQIGRTAWGVNPNIDPTNSGAPYSCYSQTSWHSSPISPGYCQDGGGDVGIWAQTYFELFTAGKKLISATQYSSDFFGGPFKFSGGSFQVAETSTSTYLFYVEPSIKTVVVAGELTVQTTTAGFLPPRMNTTQKEAISNQPTGTMVFDTSLNALNVKNSTGWISLKGDVAGPATSTLNNFAAFSDTTGKKIKDSGINSGNLPTMATAATAANKIILSAGANKQLTTTVYPIPTSIGANGTVLKSDGTNVTWQPDSAGAGDVKGPATTAANRPALYADATGKLIKEATYTLPLSAGTTGQVLGLTGAGIANWVNTGNVVGAATSTLDAISSFAGTDGKTLKNTAFKITGNNLIGPMVAMGSNPNIVPGTEYGCFSLKNHLTSPDDAGFCQILGETRVVARYKVNLDATYSGSPYPAVNFNVGPAPDNLRMKVEPFRTTNYTDFETKGNLYAGGGLLTVDSYGKKVGIGTTNVPEQLLELKSTTLGFLPPRMTTVQKEAIVPQSWGTVVFDTNLATLSVLNYTGWVALAAGPATSTTNAIAKYSGTNGSSLTNSAILINATNDISGIAKLTSTGDLVVDTNTLKVDSTNNRVGIGTASPSQVFQIDSTTSGFLPPRMTTAQKDAIVTQTPGMVVFDTTLNSLSVRNTTGWVSLSGTALLSENKIDELMDAMKKQQNQIAELTKKIEKLERR